MDPADRLRRFDIHVNHPEGWPEHNRRRRNRVQQPQQPVQEGQPEAEPELRENRDLNVDWEDEEVFEYADLFEDDDEEDVIPKYRMPGQL